jgi:hypoxanthine phosphoribosyltransferase
MSISPEYIRQVRAEADCLFTAEQVEAALAEVAQKITDKHRDNNPLVLCVMNGGLIVTGSLLLKLDFPLEQDYLHATRYRGETQGGALNWLAEPTHSLKDRHVLVIDDILDEGYTLAAIAEHCLGAGAKSVETVVLVEKRHDRKHGIQADYIGMQVEDRYLFGYGMDYKGYLRNAAGIFAVKGM